jgi:hypothetical protein
MILYHTGAQVIRNPDIHYGRKNADFGWGFYLTPDRDFTYRWARENAVVNEYVLDENELGIYTFTRDINWFQYIINRGKTLDLWRRKWNRSCLQNYGLYIRQAKKAPMKSESGFACAI